MCVISKVLKRIVYDHLNKFILTNTILADSQFGFRHQHSTTQQLLLFLNRVQNCLNSNASCDVISTKLLTVSPTTLFWLSFGTLALDQGIPFWQTPTSMHKWLLLFSLPVISGVPQGSILDSLLCLVYVNDLAQQVLHSDIFLFADNTKYLNLSHWPQTHLSNWSSNWKFSFNESKCLLLTFQSKSPTHSTLLYSINGHVIRNCHQHKDLGILMSSDLHGRPISPQSPPKRTKSFDYLTSLCVLVAAHQQRKCSITCPISTCVLFAGLAPITCWRN